MNPFMLSVQRVCVCVDVFVRGGGGCRFGLCANVTCSGSEMQMWGVGKPF